jgi:hypothetical protein
MDETLVAVAHSEIYLDEVRCGTRSSGCKRRCRGDIGAMGTVAELAGMRGERSRIGSELRDLKRDRSCSFQLPFQVVVTTCTVRGVSVSIAGVPER